jgi:hypothetical protein
MTELELEPGWEPLTRTAAAWYDAQGRPFSGVVACVGAGLAGQSPTYIGKRYTLEEQRAAAIAAREAFGQ